MPFYEYQCRACNAQVEVLQKISDPPLRKCPECGRSQMTKLVSAPVFRLKGAGWYETDFKSDKDNKRNLVEAEKEPAKAVETPAATAKPDKAETKPVAEAKPAAEARPAAAKSAAKKSKTAKRKAKR